MITNYFSQRSITATFKLMNKTGFIKSDKVDNTITVEHFIKGGFVTGDLCGGVLILENDHMISRKDLNNFFIRIK